MLLLWVLACAPSPADSATPVDSDPIVDTEPPADTACASPSTFYPDQDRDGYGSTVDAVVACQAPDDGLVWLATGGDCDDGAVGVNPDAQEVCDSVQRDEDCDGAADDDDDSAIGQQEWWRDQDRDGFGDIDDTVPGIACYWEPSRVLDHTDCDDTRDDVYPGAPEWDRDSVDRDCNGADA